MKLLIVCLLCALALWLGCALYVHFRGRERLRLGRQLFEHSGLLAPLNVLFYAFSAVPRDPLLPTQTFPELEPLTRNWRVIAKEAAALLEAGEIRPSLRHDDLAFVAFFRRGWRRFYLRWYHDFLPSARELCPRTVELLESIPSATAAAFTLLPPHTELGRHRDPFALALRYHLGLATPGSPDCALWVDGEKVVWRDGEAFVFDETYVHWARNDSDRPRLILFVDVARPVHGRLLARFRDGFGRRVLSMTRTGNRPDEEIGALNHLTPAIYRLKTFFTRAKEWNRTVYYGVKRGGLGLLLIWALWRTFKG